MRAVHPANTATGVPTPTCTAGLIRPHGAAVSCGNRARAVSSDEQPGRKGNEAMRPASGQSGRTQICQQLAGGELAGTPAGAPPAARAQPGKPADRLPGQGRLARPPAVQRLHKQTFPLWGVFLPAVKGEDRTDIQTIAALCTSPLHRQSFGAVRSVLNRNMLPLPTRGLPVRKTDPLPAQWCPKHGSARSLSTT